MNNRYIHILKYILCILLVACLAFIYLKSCKSETSRVTFTKFDQLHIFFKHYKSPVPQVMSVAVLHTKNPNLMAAVSIIESNGIPWAVGDRGASVGAFQVQGVHWGRVNKGSPVQQALQAEKVLFSNRSSCKRTMLATYNGGPKRPKAAYVYADKVLRLEKILKGSVYEYVS